MHEILGLIHKLAGAAKVEIVRSHGRIQKISLEINQENISRLTQIASLLPTLSNNAPMLRITPDNLSKIEAAHSAHPFTAEKYWINDAGDIKYCISPIIKADSNEDPNPISSSNLYSNDLKQPGDKGALTKKKDLNSKQAAAFLNVSPSTFNREPIVNGKRIEGVKWWEYYGAINVGKGNWHYFELEQLKTIKPFVPKRKRGRPKKTPVDLNLNLEKKP